MREKAARRARDALKLQSSSSTPAPAPLPVAPAPKSTSPTSLAEERRLVNHFVMNLPATAIEFLDAFRGLYLPLLTLDGFQAAYDRAGGASTLPIVHCYCFTKDLVGAEEDILAVRPPTLLLKSVLTCCLGTEGDQGDGIAGHESDARFQAQIRAGRSAQEGDVLSRIQADVGDGHHLNWGMQRGAVFISRRALVVYRVLAVLLRLLGAAVRCCVDPAAFVVNLTDCGPSSNGVQIQSTICALLLRPLCATMGTGSAQLLDDNGLLGKRRMGGHC